MGLFPRTYTVQEMAAACFSSAQGFRMLAKSRSAEGGIPLPEREVAATATRVSSHKPLFSFSRAAAGGKHGELESPAWQRSKFAYQADMRYTIPWLSGGIMLIVV